MGQTKVSVIVPIYNVSSYLRQALDSLASQDLSDIEFICIDDCSTDDCAKILYEYAESDPRFIPIYSKLNQGRSKARKDAVMASHGEYIMFMDSDDTFSPDACSTAYNAIVEKDVDILQFPLKWVILNEDASPNKDYMKKTAETEDFVIRAPHADLLKMHFDERKWSFNAVNKIFRREICVNAYNDISDERLNNGEDAYVYFLMTYYSNSFASISGHPLYFYYYGRGFYGNTSLTLSQFRNLCDLKKITDMLNAFLDTKEDGDELRYLVEEIDDDSINNTAYNWGTFLAKRDRPAGYDMMCETWGPEKTVAALAHTFWYDKACVMDGVYGAKVLKRHTGKIRTIAMYYHHITIGGVERVMGTLSHVWQDMGYRIVLFTDTAPTDNDMDMAPGIKRVVLTDWREMDGDRYAERTKILAKALIENEIDVVDYNAWVSPFLEWDTLLIKSVGVAFNYHVHNIYTYDIGMGTLLPERLLATRFMDSVVALMKVDSLFLSCYNSNLHQINNPVFYDDPASLPQAPLKGHNVLWLARFSPEKNPVDAVEVFAAVKKQIPDATLTMVGAGLDYLEKGVRDAVKKYGLEDSVILPGFSTNVSEHYLKADVLIQTASFEGFCLVYLETGLHGVPIVTYSMEYLELIRDCKSMISVPMGDTDTMADEVVKLFNDDALRTNTGTATRQEMLDFIATDIAAEWKKVFDSIEQGTGAGIADDDTRIMIQTIIDFYHRGVISHDKDSRTRINQMDKWIKELDKTNLQIIDDLKRVTGWLNDMTEAKKFFEEQTGLRDKHISELNENIAQLNKWIDDLKVAKDYFLEQNQMLTGQLEETRAWTAELEKAKEFFLGRIDSTKSELDAEKERTRKLEEELNKYRSLGSYEHVSSRMRIVSPSRWFKK